MLGKDASLFTIEGLRTARDKKAGGGEEFGDEPEDADNKYYDFSCKPDGKGGYVMNKEELNEAFIVETAEKDKDGKLTVTKSRVRDTKEGKKAFTKLVNIFNSYTPNPREEGIVKAAILADASRGEDLSKTNEAYAHLIAEHLVRFTGAAALNDTDFVGYDSMTRLIHTQGYRTKMLKASSKSEKFDGQDEEWIANRGGKVGNMHSIDQFKSLIVDPMLGITTLTGSEERGPDGKPLYNKPILKVMQELNEERRLMREEMERERSQGREVGQERKEELARGYRRTATQLYFVRNAEQHYLQNMYNRGVKLNEVIRGGKGIDFEKYSGYATEIGSYFKRKEFQDDFVAMETDIRYAYSTYGNLGYSMAIRGYDTNMEQWRDMSLAESMFGHQMLDIPEFRDKNGQVDPDRVTKKSAILYKQFLLTYMAAEFIASRQMRKWSTDPRHEMAYYNEALDIMSRLAGDFKGDERNMNNVEVSEFLFDKDRMNWLRKTSGTTRGKLYGWSAIKSLTIGRRKKEESIGEGFNEMISMLIKSFVS